MTTDRGIYFQLSVPRSLFYLLSNPSPHDRFVVIDPQLRWPTILTYLIESPTQRQTLRATEPLPSLVPQILPPEELFEQWH